MTEDEFKEIKSRALCYGDEYPTKLSHISLVLEIERLRKALQYYADGGGHVAKDALGYYETEIDNGDKA